MQGLVDQLQAKIKTYKKQIEEAEEIAALNLAKFRQAQGHLADAEERADLNEQALAKAKTKGRAGSSVPMVSLQNNICIMCIMFHWIELPNFESIFFSTVRNKKFII